MSDDGEDNAAGKRSAGFSSGIIIGAVIGVIVADFLAPVSGLFSYPFCALHDLSDNFMLGAYDLRVELYQENRRQAADVKLTITVLEERLADLYSEKQVLDDLRIDCVRGHGPGPYFSEQEIDDCVQTMRNEPSGRSSQSLQQLIEFHSFRNQDAAYNLWIIERNSESLIALIKSRIKRRQDLPAVCHQFFEVTTFEEIEERPIRNPPTLLW